MVKTGINNTRRVPNCNFFLRGPKYFRLDIGSKSTPVTVDRLKPHTGTAETAPAAPPRRGHPL